LWRQCATSQPRSSSREQRENPWPSEKEYNAKLRREDVAKREHEERDAKRKTGFKGSERIRG
jgi:hypothetical protein